jgi:DNA-binding IclR family transcriptional regulator
MAPSVPAVERALRILNAFKDSQLDYGVSELSKSLDINKSTVHGILRTLTRYRMLEQDPGSRKYRLGPGLIELGATARARRDLGQVARPHLEQLMKRTHETILLGVFEDDGITIIDRVQPARELHIAAANGQRLPFSAGSFGRAFLAWKQPAEVDRLLNLHGLRSFTETSISDPEEYRLALEAVQRRGYAIDDTEEYLKGVWAVSAPIHDLGGILAVLTVVGFAGRMTEARKRTSIEAATLAARQISLEMGALSTDLKVVERD